MTTTRIIKNTFFYGVVPKMSMLLSIVMLPLTTPFLTTFDYGVYGVLISYVVLFMSIAPLGMNVHLTNSFFEYPKRYHIVWGEVLAIVLLSSCIFGGINMLILMLTLPIDSFTEKMALCAVGSVPICLVVNGFLAQHLFPLVERPVPLVFTNFMGPVLGMLVSFVLIYYYRLGYWGLVSSSAVSSIFIFAIFIKYVWYDYHIWPIWTFRWKRVWSLLKVALPLVPHTLGFVLLASSARIVMSQNGVGYDEIGLFSHGSTMGDYATVITSGLVTALMPLIQRTYRSKNYIAYRRLYFLCQLVALTASFVICVWMPEIYTLLIRNQHLVQSCDIACLLCFANVVYSFYIFMSIPVFIEKDTLQLLWLVFIPGILNFVCCYTFIPIYGYISAVYSTMFFYWAQLLIPFVVGYYKKSVKTWLGDRRFALLVLLLLVLDLCIANVLMHTSLLLKICATLLSLIVLSVFYRRSKIAELF